VEENSASVWFRRGGRWLVGEGNEAAEETVECAETVEYILEYFTANYTGSPGHLKLTHQFFEKFWTQDESTR
jgi:hypothetical protein